MIPGKKYAIIVAGGSGSRMGHSLPKQFLEIGGKPILMHTISKFKVFDPTLHIILVLPAEHVSTWHQIASQLSFNIPVQLVTGGKTRFESVKNALLTITEDGLVAIHDGVRPFINHAIIESSFKIADKEGNAVASVALKESIRELKDDSNFAVDRSNFRLIQTPQTFRIPSIKLAYQEAPHDNFTDDASVAEAAGQSIHLIEGSYFNIKITTPEDLAFAEVLISNGH